MTVGNPRSAHGDEQIAEGGKPGRPVCHRRDLRRDPANDSSDRMVTSSLAQNTESPDTPGIHPALLKDVAKVITAHEGSTRLTGGT